MDDGDQDSDKSKVPETGQVSDTGRINPRNLDAFKTYPGSQINFQTYPVSHYNCQSHPGGQDDD